MRSAGPSVSEGIGHAVQYTNGNPTITIEHESQVAYDVAAGRGNLPGGTEPVRAGDGASGLASVP